MSSTCERVNTYEILEHVLGIDGLHPHGLKVVRRIREKIVDHLNGMPALRSGIVLDIGCGNGSGTYELAQMLEETHHVVGIDINKHAIEKAQVSFVDQKNLSFFRGDLFSYLEEYVEQKVSAVICVSVSMFIHDLPRFYGKINHSLLEGGIFVDAPFLFRDSKVSLSEKFKHDTYAICGCSMKMVEYSELKEFFYDAGFVELDSLEYDFELMNFSVLFRDYSARYLVNNFCKNILIPPSYFGKISSWYLLSRTLKILFYFTRHKSKYVSGEFIAIKSAY